MNTHAWRRTVRTALVSSFLALGGCAVTGGIDSGIGSGTDSGIGSGFGSGYGIGGQSTAIGKVTGVRALGDGELDIDPYTLEPFGMETYGNAMGLDPYGYPMADWYGGYGYGYPVYLFGAPGALGYAATPLVVAPSPGRAIHPHPGPSPRLRSRLGPVTRVGAAP